MLNSFKRFYIFFIDIAKQSQPAIKHKPPKGVMAPIMLKLLKPLTCKAINTYKEPLKIMIPKVNNMAQIFSNFTALVLKNKTST